MEMQNLTKHNVLDQNVESDTEEHSSSLLEYVNTEDEVNEEFYSEIGRAHV